VSEGKLNTATPLDGPSLNPDRLTVRGRDLNDLVGSLSYPAAIYHLLTGDLPSRSQSDQLANWLLATLRTMTPDQPLAAGVRQSVALGASDTGALVAALALGDGVGLPATLDRTTLVALGLERYEAGLYYFAVAPLLHCYALEAGRAGEMEKRLALLEGASDYVAAIFALASGRALASGAKSENGRETERAIFDDVMVAFHAGLGNLAPTIALPRGAISTRASTAMALAAGYTAAGPAHVGACRVVMGYFAEIVASAPSNSPSDPSTDSAADLETHARAWIDGRLAAGERVIGFGHPLFRQDPRNPHLRDLVRAQHVNSPYLLVYDTVAERMRAEKKLYPNIDAIAAALFLTLGIAPAYGTALFLCARMAAMVAHIEEARHEPPFGARREDRRTALGEGR
jgi:citrate synthase